MNNEGGKTPDEMIAALLVVACAVAVRDISLGGVSGSSLLMIGITAGICVLRAIISFKQN